ncbi:MAG: nucleoside recognition domain-containing protein, partial [Paludibacteraceae bacterium]|nr:nucleoside recognition domain-containing protein [Paludibacteraceae bacterium]
MKKLPRYLIEALVLVLLLAVVFGVLGTRMGAGNMMNTIIHTAHDLLLNTVFFLMGITVLSGAFGKLLVEFGVVRILEKILRPLMKPLFGLPGVAALGAVLTFLSDNPAIISLAKDKQFASYFKKYQLVSLTNFGTAFGMGLVVITFMIGQGFSQGAFVGLVGAVVGGLVSTRLMQLFTLRSHPEFKLQPAVDTLTILKNKKDEIIEETPKDSVFIRALNAILDGGKVGVELGLAIIPGVLVISTAVMMLTFGPAGDEGAYIGAA